MKEDGNIGSVTFFKKDYVGNAKFLFHSNCNNMPQKFLGKV